VAVLDVREDEALTQELGQERARFFQVDVSDAESLAAAVKATLAWVRGTGKPIGGVVCCAGVGLPGKVSSKFFGWCAGVEAYLWVSDHR